MHYTISTFHKDFTSDCLILAQFEDGQWAFPDDQLSSALKEEIMLASQLVDFKANTGNLLPLLNLKNSSIPRILILGLGKKDGIGHTQFASAFYNAIKWACDKGFKKISSFICHKSIKAAVEASGHALYRYDALKTQTKDATTLTLIDFIAPHDQQATIQTSLEQAKALVTGMNFAKDLGNAPSNLLTPSALKDYALELAQQPDSYLHCDYLNQDQMKQLGMNTLLSVAKGSHEEPYLIQLTYKHPDATSAPIVLVGKGVTFDSGGISLKPGAGMDEMKYDMCGAASVLGTIKSLSELKAKTHVIAIVPAVENMPSGQAAKPGDIVTTMNGLTVENLNTDAEGRLILCDALTYAEQYEPRAVIDVATLTGAIIIALGRHPHGLFSNDQTLTDALQRASENSGDRVWPLPMWDDYKAQLDSNFADLANIGGREAGSITAAVFLAQFAKKYAWAHLDIAGTAWVTGKEKGATGRPVPLLLNYILNNLD